MQNFKILLKENLRKLLQTEDQKNHVKRNKEEIKDTDDQSRKSVTFLKKKTENTDRQTKLEK